MTAEDRADRIDALIHDQLEAANTGELLVLAERAEETAFLARQAYDDERAAFLSDHHGEGA